MNNIGTSMTHIAEMLEDIARQAREAGEGHLRLWLVCPHSYYPEGGGVPALVVRAEGADAARTMATQHAPEHDAQEWGVYELTASGAAGVVVTRGAYWW